MRRSHDPADGSTQGDYFGHGRLPLIRRALARIRKRLTPRIAGPDAAGSTIETARLAQGPSPVSAPADDAAVASRQEDVNAVLSPPSSPSSPSSPSRSTGAPALSKERVWKEDGRYLISYRFPETRGDAMRSPDGGDHGSNGVDGEDGKAGERGEPGNNGDNGDNGDNGENGVGDHESASLGSDAL